MLSNATKFTKAGEVVVKVTAKLVFDTALEVTQTNSVSAINLDFDSEIESGNQSGATKDCPNPGEMLAVTENIQFPTLPTEIYPNLDADQYQVSPPAAPKTVKLVIEVVPLDSQTFEELRELLGEEAEGFWLELVEKFLEVAPPKLPEIVDAVNRADAPVIKASAHALRGACTTVGAMPLFKLCTQLEQMARNETFADSDVLMCKIAAEYQRVKVALASSY